MNSNLIIPKPNHLTQSSGVFILTKNAKVSFERGGEFAARLIMGLTKLTEGNPADIHLSFDESIQNGEAYILTIGYSGIDIKAKTPVGLLYGAETLRQLLSAEVEKDGITADAALPCLSIEDAPRYPYRGFMLDVSRHFFDIREIKRILDLMALIKLNRFHWHLSDDQGWRIEIKRYPELTQIGSKRDGTLVYGWLWGKKYVNSKIYQGYYTQEQIREVVAYAGERGIEVIPEIDLPGHSTALLSSLPQLSCTCKQLRPSTGARPGLDLICAGKESSYKILFHIFDELIKLFPYKHIHIGGDEANKTCWKHCPSCQAKIKEQNLENEEALQGYFMNRIAGYLMSKGCNVICWNDGLHKDALPGMLCQYWLWNKKETASQVNSGRKTIYSYAYGCYLDYSYKNFGLYNSYALSPGKKEFNEEGVQNIIGIEAPLWSEKVYSRDRMDWQMFPRILAISETAWTPQNLKNYPDFIERIFWFEKRLDTLSVRHAVKECYLKRRKTGLLGLLDILLPGEHPAMREYRKFNEVKGYNKTDGKRV